MATKADINSVGLGDTLVILATARRADGTTPISLVGATVKAGFKGASGATVALSSPSTGIMVTDAANGVSSIAVTPAQLLTLGAGRAIYDVVVIEQDTTRSTILYGAVDVFDHVTTT